MRAEVPDTDSNRLNKDRCPPRCMYPGELLDLLWRYKNPKFWSVGIESNRWGARQRDAVGLSAHGTIWVATLEEKDFLYPVPCDCLPYAPIREAEFNPALARFKGKMVRGWRSLLTHLVKSGTLYPHEHLTYLCGTDTMALAPKGSYLPWWPR